MTNSQAENNTGDLERAMYWEDGRPLRKQIQQQAAEIALLSDESMQHDVYARELQDENHRLHRHIIKQDAEIERINNEYAGTFLDLRYELHDKEEQIEQLQARVKYGPIVLPKIDTLCRQRLCDTGLIDVDGWTQDAVDFACELNRLINHPGPGQPVPESRTLPPSLAVGG